MTRFISRACATGLAAAIAPGLTHAADRGLSIEEIVVTAQKKEEGANSISLAIATYTGEDLSALGITDTRDLGRLLPGFSYADGGFKSRLRHHQKSPM